MKLNLVEDPRTNLEKMRRVDLYRFADAHGLSMISANMPATVMRTLIQQSGLNGTEPFPTKKITTEQYEESKDWGQGAAVAQEAEVDIKAMNWNQLRAYATRQGINWNKKDTREILERRLNGENLP